MNNLEVLEEAAQEFDVTRWFGGIGPIIQMLADDPLFQVAGAALLIGFAFLLAFLLTSTKKEI